jgi:hypothetical protein
LRGFGSKWTCLWGKTLSLPAREWEDNCTSGQCFRLVYWICKSDGSVTCCFDYEDEYLSQKVGNIEDGSCLEVNTRGNGFHTKYGINRRTLYRKTARFSKERSIIHSSKNERKVASRGPNAKQAKTRHSNNSVTQAPCASASN